MVKYAWARGNARSLLAGLALALTSVCAHAQVTGTINGLAADAQVDKTGSSAATIANLSSTYAYVGATNSTNHCLVWVFQIPGTILSDPFMRFTQGSVALKLGQSIHPASGVNGDFYGVGYSTSAAVSTADFYYGASDTGNMLIQDNVVTPATASGANVTINNTLMVDYLNQCLDYAREDGATTAYVFFRMSPDGHSYGNRYSFAMNEAGGTILPRLTYTAEQVSAWRSVPLGGGGYVTGIISDPSGNQVYIRTDVGGAYRFDPVKGEWKSITETIVPVTQNGANDAQSISSIALDPVDSNIVYLAVGHTPTSTIKGIFQSTNAGLSWIQINNTIQMHGNGAHRDIGERLVVDPNNPNLMWFGSTQSGLHKGVKSGSTWTWSQVPATSVPWGAIGAGNDPAGVAFVVCDKNGSSTITYAGVFDNVGTTGGIYRTTNGTDWAKVAGDAFMRPQRAQVAPNGTVYITAKTDGVFKLPRNGTVAKLAGGLATDANTIYRGLAVAQGDPNGNTAYVADIGGKFYRTTNGGTNWSAMGTNFNSGSRVRQEPDGTPSLTGGWWGNTAALLANPTNANELWVTDFYGVYRTQNAQDMGTTNGPMFYLLQKNLEETVVGAIKNAPTGARLMNGVADVAGFRHNDTTKRPYSTFGNKFYTPDFGSTVALDFSEANHNVWARTWLNSARDGGSAAVSTDGGASWLPAGMVAKKTITNANSIGTETWDVTPYIAGQKLTSTTGLVTLHVSAGNSITPLYSISSIPFYSKDNPTDAYRPKLIINGSTQLTAIEDATVADATPSTPNGASEWLTTSYNFFQAPYTRRFYLKFNLGSVSGPITSATLQLTRRVAADTVSWPVGVFACPNTTWSESTVVWNGRPSLPAGNEDHFGNPRYWAGSVELRGGRVAVSSTDPNRMVWLPEGWAKAPHYSTDRGATWSPCFGGSNSIMKNQWEPGCIINQLTSDRVNGKFYMTRFAGANGGANHPIMVSTDGGANFTQVGSVYTNTYNEYRAQLVAAPAANHVWMSDDGADRVPEMGGLWKSTDGGVTWAQIPGTLKTRAVTFGQGKPGSGYAYTVFMNGKLSGVKGIFRSDDYGATWVKLADMPTPSVIEAMAGDRQNYKKVWIGTHGRGVFEGQ
jgi:hypothetical protein